MSVLHITKENFQREVLESEKPVLLDFWAAWCGPCRMVGPILEEVAEEQDRSPIFLRCYRAAVKTSVPGERRKLFGIRDLYTAPG